MEKTLKYLVIVGLVVWAMLLVAEHWSGGSPLSYFHDANRDERCTKYKQTLEDSEGDEILGYRGRMQQFMNGCW